MAGIFSPVNPTEATEAQRGTCVPSLHTARLVSGVPGTNPNHITSSPATHACCGEKAEGWTYPSIQKSAQKARPRGSWRLRGTSWLTGTKEGRGVRKLPIRAALLPSSSTAPPLLLPRRTGSEQEERELRQMRGRGGGEDTGKGGPAACGLVIAQCWVQHSGLSETEMGAGAPVSSLPSWRRVAWPVGRAGAQGQVCDIH